MTQAAPVNTPRSATEASIRTEILRAQLVRLQWTVQMGLVLASLLVPVTRVTGSRDDPVTRSLFDTLGFFLTESATDLGSVKAYPRALEGGRLATLVGVVLILVTFVLLVVLSTMLHGSHPPRRATLWVSLVAAALLIGIGLVWLGQTWLPDRDSLAYTSAWGLFVLGATAVWAIQTARGPVGANE